MIRFCSPYSPERDLGKAYNDEMRLTPSPNDWVCLTDLDCQFLTADIGHQLQEIVNMNPDAGMLTALCNRVGNLEQCYNRIINDDSNILNHRRIALQLQKTKRQDVRELSGVISGFLMLIKKSTWEEIGEFPEGRGLLGVDNLISRKVLATGKKILLMEGVYMFHFYRLDTGIQNKEHLNITPEQAQVTGQTPLRSRRKRSRFI
jgi:GT2 family glycosyltransferase